MTPEKKKQRSREYYARNRETLLAKCKEYYTKNKDAAKKTQAAYRKTHKANAAKYHIVRNYGISLEQFQERLLAQGGKCAICGCLPESQTRRFAVDHDHTTGTIRGILCHACNTSLGGFKDDIEVLQKAIEYLRRNQ